MLHINDLTYRLGARLLIDQATVALPRCARVGLVGRNGSGKTTLFRIIAGELSAESGGVQIRAACACDGSSRKRPAARQRC